MRSRGEIQWGEFVPSNTHAIGGEHIRNGFSMLKVDIIVARTSDFVF